MVVTVAAVTSGALGVPAVLAVVKTAGAAAATAGAASALTTGAIVSGATTGAIVSAVTGTDGVGPRKPPLAPLLFLQIYNQDASGWDMRRGCLPAHSGDVRGWLVWFDTVSSPSSVMPWGWPLKTGLPSLLGAVISLFPPPLPAYPASQALVPQSAPRVASQRLSLHQ